VRPEPAVIEIPVTLARLPECDEPAITPLPSVKLVAIVPDEREVR
jgi:hypothetical protein